MLISTQMCAWLNMRIVIVHDQVIGLFDSVLFVRLYVLPVSRESESGRYKRAEYERDRVSLVPAPPPPLPAPGSGDLEPHAR